MNYLFHVKKQAMLCIGCVSGWLITYGIMRHFEWTDPITTGQILRGTAASFTFVLLVPLLLMYLDSLKR